jgi:CDP-diacylglycerol--glycerol-3-phosphate 3-phosphatidyltransferase
MLGQIGNLPQPGGGCRPLGKPVMQWTLPNLLTLLRIVLIPVLVVVYYLPGKWVPLLSAAVFGLAAVTDWLDGYLARRLKQLSVFGAFLDPVADKLMVAVALVLIVSTNHSLFFSIPVAVIIGREIAISALREWMSEIGERATVAVSIIGKIKTTAQMLAILLLLYDLPVAGYPTHEIGVVLLYVAAILTLWSMMIYLRAAWPLLARNPGDSGEGDA